MSPSPPFSEDFQKIFNDCFAIHRTLIITMRRIDIFAISFGIFLAGGLLYGGFKLVGLDSLDAGIWSQVLLVIVVIAWVSTYLFRVGTRTMTFHQQRADYEEAALQRRLDAMTPEELAKMQADIEAEEANAGKK